MRGCTSSSVGPCARLCPRYDGDPLRNAEIQPERLSSAEIAAIEQADPERSKSPFTTARLADTIHVLDGGRIVESGSHDELRSLGGRYARSWQAQQAPAQTWPGAG